MTDDDIRKAPWAFSESDESFGVTDTKPNKIGSGATSIVYRAQLRGEHVAARALFALRRPDEHGLDEDLMQLRVTIKRCVHELHAVSSLAPHPRIVMFKGVAVSDEALDVPLPKWVLSELVDGQTLQKRLSVGEPLPAMQLTHIAMQLVEGLAFIASQGLIHGVLVQLVCSCLMCSAGELKSKNVLLTQQQDIKICGLGLSALLRGVGAQTGAIRSNRYRAPETLLAHAACTDTTKVDVYALGVITVEMVLRSPPADSHAERVSQAEQALKSPAVALLAEYECTGVGMLLTKCVSEHPIDRPTPQMLLTTSWWPQLDGAPEGEPPVIIIDKVAKLVEESVSLLQANDPQLQRLELSCCGVLATEGSAIASAVEANTVLAELDLGYNPQCLNGHSGKPGFSAIADAIRSNSTLTQLDLAASCIGAGGMAIAAALEENKALTSLNLNKNELGDDVAIALADALVANRTLLELDLWSNAISNTGSRALARALMKTVGGNQTLTRLNMSANRIGDIGATALAKALEDNGTLMRLNLASNTIGDVGARALAEALEENLQLQRLDLYGNLNGPNLRKEIQDLMSRRQRQRAAKERARIRGE